jgi:tetratricopeptide (TPR) repeat protein
MNAVAFRNLGLAYHEKGDLQKANEAYLAALKANPVAGMAIVELGRLNREMKIPYEKQIALFEEYIDIVSGYDQALTQLIELYVLTGDYGDALKWLTTHHFKSWEGQYGIHQYWIQSNIKQGDIEFASGRYKKALEHYKLSVTYPDNLEVAEQQNTIHARKHFKIGRTLEALGEKEQAQKYFNQVVADKVSTDNAYQFYRGQALKALGKKKQAIAVYEQMLAALDKQEAQQEHIEQLEVTDVPVRMHKAKALLLFSRSLALEGLGRTDEAEKVRKAALELDPLVPLNAFKPPRFGS